MRRAAPALLALVLGLGACGGGGGEDVLDSAGGEEPEQRTTTTRVEVLESIARDEGGFDPQRIYKRDAPGVVTIYSVFGDGSLDQVLGGREGGGGGGVGSGFVLNARGEIATNAHVVTQGEGAAIRPARDVYVEFSDGNRVEADIVGQDPNADVAMLRVDPRGLTLRPLSLGSADDIAVGEPVAAIGSPFGERQSLSVGVVSAVDRAIESLTAFRISGAIQTDAAINPGNSGGPLVNARGEVIGVNQQIKTASGGGEGVGFAVPVDMVRRSLDQLREKGRVDYAYLGVSSVPLFPQLVERFDLPVDRGAWLQAVTDDGPADDAGLRGGGGQETFQGQTYNPGGDILTRVGDTAITDADDLSEAVARLDPGRTVTVELHRDGERRTMDVELGTRPLDPDAG